MIKAYRELAGADIHVADYASLPSATSALAGRRAITDAPLATGWAPYLRWVCTGTKWQLDGEQVLLWDTSAVTGVAGTAVQVLKQWTLPAGLLAALRLLKITANYSRSGTTDNLTARVLLGTAGLFTDQQIGGSALVTGTARQGVLGFAGYCSAATTWTNFLGGGAYAMSDGSISSAAYPSTTTIASNTGALKLSMAASMAASTDLPTCGHMIITGV